MKKFVMLMTMFLFLLPATGFAADLRNVETVGKNETVKNLYLAGQNPTVEANVTGDLVAAGSTVTVDGDVSGGVLVAGSTLNFNGKVSGSLRVAGGNVNINGEVGGDVVVFGGNVVFGTKSIIDGDVLVFGGTVDFKGSVLGSIKDGYIGSVNLGGSVSGDVTFNRVGTLVVTSDAAVTGELEYSSQNEGTISSSAKIGGKTVYNKVAANNTLSSLVPNLGSVIFGLLIAFVTIMAFILLAPKFTKNVVNNAVVKPWSKIGIGLLAFIVAPIVMFLFAITFFGLGIMGYLLVVYVALIALAGTISAILAGSYTWKFAAKDKELLVNWKTAFVGVLIVALLKFIPIIGWLAVFVLFLIVFGTLVTMSFDFLKAQRA